MEEVTKYHKKPHNTALSIAFNGKALFTFSKFLAILIFLNLANLLLINTPPKCVTVKLIKQQNYIKKL